MSIYKFKKSIIKPELDIKDIMTSQQGTEGRFKSRFIKYAGTAADFTKSVDTTGQAIDDFRTSVGMISEQKRGIDKMFLLAERAVLEISNLEKDSGVHQVDNIPLPTNAVRDSYGKKMGYVTLAVSFMTEGLLHFMEETINLQEALNSRDRTISALAAQIPHLEIIGAYEDLQVSDLTSAPTVDIPSYVKPEKGERATNNSPLPGPKKVKK